VHGALSGQLVSGNGVASGPFMALKKFTNYAVKRGL
jgi:hypothetical protein